MLVVLMPMVLNQCGERSECTAGAKEARPRSQTSFVCVQFAVGT